MRKKSRRIRSKTIKYFLLIFVGVILAGSASATFAWFTSQQATNEFHIDPIPLSNLTISKEVVIPTGVTDSINAANAEEAAKAEAANIANAETVVTDEPTDAAEATNEASAETPAEPEITNVANDEAPTEPQITGEVNPEAIDEPNPDEAADTPPTDAPEQPTIPNQSEQPQPPVSNQSEQPQPVTQDVTVDEVQPDLQALPTSDGIFTFTVTFEEEREDITEYTYLDENGEKKIFHPGDNLQIHGGKSVTFLDLPVGMKYSVSEDYENQDPSQVQYLPATNEVDGTVLHNSEDNLQKITNMYYTQEYIDSLQCRLIINKDVYGYYDPEKEYEYEIDLKKVTTEDGKLTTEDINLKENPIRYELWDNEENKSLGFGYLTTRFFSLKAGQEIRLYDLKGGISYQVKELVPEDADYETSAIMQCGFLVGEIDDEGFCVQTLNFHSDFPDIIPVRKQIISKAEEPDTETTFQFILEPITADAPMPASAVDGKCVITITGEGTNAFDEIPVTVQGMTWQYRIYEKQEKAKKYTYDTTEYLLTITAVSLAPDLKVTRSITKVGEGTVEYTEALFINTYDSTDTTDPENPDPTDPTNPDNPKPTDPSKPSDPKPTDPSTPGTAIKGEVINQTTDPGQKQDTTATDASTSDKDKNKHQINGANIPRTGDEGHIVIWFLILIGVLLFARIMMFGIPHRKNQKGEKDDKEKKRITNTHIAHPADCYGGLYIQDLSDDDTI